MNPVNSFSRLRRGRAIIAAAVVGLLAVAAVACSGGGNGGSPLAAGDIPASLPTNYLAGNASPSLSSSSGVTSYVAADGTAQTGIWVTGVGTLNTPADTAVVNLGVESRATTVADARDAAATAMTNVLDAIKALGVSEDDINTTYFNIQPQIQWIDKSDALGKYSQQQIVGYIVTNQVNVKVRDLTKVSDVLDSATQQGGDLIRINSISFTVADPAKYAEDMRKSAAQDAKAKAQIYADAMGVKLGDLVFLTETGSSTPTVNRTVAPEALDASAGSVPTPIQSGDVNLTTTIQAAFAIVP